MLQRSFLILSSLVLSCGGQELDAFEGLSPETAELGTRQDFASRRAETADPVLCGLYEALRGNQVLGYNRARALLFSEVDVQNGKLECVYSGKATRASGGIPSGWNCEHSWPQSQFDKKPALRSDLHHLFATTEWINSVRGDWDFGAADQIDKKACDAQGECSNLGNSQKAGQTVFDVRPPRRGDVARAHFYMVARYRCDPKAWLDDDRRAENGSIDDVEEAVLRRWHAEDPVDAWELTRNDRIERLQGNRNPFIDDPALVDQIRNF